MSGYLFFFYDKYVILSLSKRKYIQLNMSLPVWYNYVCVWHIPFNIMFKKYIVYHFIKEIILFVIINLIMAIS